MHLARILRVLFFFFGAAAAAPYFFQALTRNLFGHWLLSSNVLLGGMMRASELADTIVPGVNRPYVMCMGASNVVKVGSNVALA